ncbi:MAG: N-acyl-D-aspartate/D-glutamate deacylase, partial [Actinobacteria bacterium 13_1_20CM_3_71_11]
MFDLVLAGGEVLDGTGCAPVRADVGVRDGRVTAVDRLDGAAAAARIDATGCYVAPGFVDAHVHADAAVLDPAVQLALLRQGITTVVLGQDGLSYAPGSPSTVEFVSRYFGAVNGAHPGFPGGTVADLLTTYDRATAVNTAYLVPHGTVRYEVLGPAPRAAEPDELAAMRRLVEAGLGDGAVGLSSGLEYAPGRYADAAELAYLCAPLGERPYVTHMRGYEAQAPVGLAEALEIGRRAGVGVHVSHLHGPAEVVLPLLDEAVTFDSYPYLRGSSTLALVTLPDWLPTADLDATAAALRDAAVRDRLRAQWPDELWPRITLACVGHPDWAWTQGLRLPTAAGRAGLDPAELAVELLLADELRVGCVFDQPPTNTDESVRALLRHPCHLGSSDGIYRGGHPHPRGYGAFARLLARHVRELGDWSWPEAVVHLAGRPAGRFGLTGRGQVRPGYAADLIVLDPATVADRATYDSPQDLADGVSYAV